LEEIHTTSVSRPSNAILIVGIVIALVFPFLNVLLNGFTLTFNSRMILSRFVFWAEIAFLWLYAIKVEKQKLLIWTEKRSGLKFILASIVLIYALSFAAGIVAAVPSWLGWHESNQFIKRLFAFMKDKPFTVFFICITAGFTEEFIFRGYILTRLSVLITNKYLPIIISSLLFSAVHFSFHSLREFIFAFLVGVIMSFHYQKYGNIKPLIAAHILIDVLGFFVGAHFVK